MMNLIEQLKVHEGFEANYYQCTSGKLTIGYGRNVGGNPFSLKELAWLGRCEFDETPMTEGEAEQLLVIDVNEVTALIKEYLSWGELNSARQAVCINMAFNLGVTGLFKFKNMMRAIRKQCYREAAIEMLDSRWANQVGSRADELAQQMNAGVWQ
ncbi:glycoside hydrolase family protein [Colwellia psychrerythraea]|uniref:Lysozyme n=1 Tax=Colwellia psychrerythraea TaxID=28229 RepID=A0A099KGY8_COLPS|nr:glycoside hydrolase family protein [Colwellia psychrerythraea]KGJ89525.1 glycoside hydrolase family 24 [Colwellia psychrerythraea]